VVALAIATLVIVRAFVTTQAASASEPRSYRLTSVWDAENRGLPIGYDADTGTVLLWENHDENGPFSPHYIAAVNARTGKQKWVGAPAGWDVNVDYVPGSKLTSDAIIVQSDYQQSSPAIAALSLSDGKVKWKLNTPGKSARPTAVTADVVVVAWDSTTLRGLSAADGDKLWETPVADGCKADELGGAGDLVVIEVLCEKKRYLESLDPKSGKSRWQHSVSIEDEDSADNLSVRGNAALLRDHEHLLILDESGRALLDEPTQGRGEANFVVTDDVLVAAYHDQAGQDILAAIDVKQATVRWTHRLAVASLTVAGGKLYAAGLLPEPLLPVGLYEIDLATGRMAVSPTHLLYAGYDSLVAVDGDIVVSYYFEAGTTPHTSHLDGHRLTPAEAPVGFAGGAPAADWPDSCSLLEPGEIPVTAGVSYQEQPEQVTVTDTLLPQPANCRYQPSSVSAPVVTVSVAWVGNDTEQAVALMSRIAQQYNDNTAVAGIGEQAIEVIRYGEPQSTIEVYFRVGARIGKVAIPGDTATAHQLAKLAVTRLG
jgi:outer membrane protein assembly factor BamB